MQPAHKMVVQLEAGQREVLEQIVRTGTRPAAMIRRAHILLKADAEANGSAVPQTRRQAGGQARGDRLLRAPGRSGALDDEVAG